ncbi:MAG TPA: peptidase domain-containing ABC transporter [Allosphingosinicella sp.]|jgi:ATP-binding cassette subfamily B protein RaxB
MTRHPIDLITAASRRTPMVHQSEASECGLASIAMVAGHHGHSVDLGTLRRRFSLSLKGATLRQMMSVAEKLSLSARSVRGEVESLDHLPLPAILHWNMNHFVVLTRISRAFGGKKYHINDPARGPLVLSRDELSRSWTGVAMELSKASGFVPLQEKKSLRLRQLWNSLSGFWVAARRTLLLSVLLQICALAAPFYLQIAIDTAYPAFDLPLLQVLAIGFAGIALISFASTWLRSLTLNTLTNLLSYQIVANIFRHMLRLPLQWFEKRHVGDIVSRFNSSQPVTQLLSTGFLTSIIDGILAIATFLLMLLYSPMLALVAAAALIIYLGIRLLFFQALKAGNINVITTDALEQTTLIESIRGVSAVKAFGQEDNRLQMWQRRKADAVNASIRLGRLSSGFDSSAQFIINLERIVFALIAVGLAMKGSLTIGMIFAFQAYKQQFLDAGVRLVGQAINYRVVQLHLERISDIALTPPESDGGGTPVGETGDAMGIELRGVSYRYGMGEPDILSRVNLAVRPGEMIVLIGPSGGGKTTLMKVMMGLFDPVQGQVLINDVDLAKTDRSSFRRRIGCVAQDDVLYGGSIAENIAFFDPQLDMDRVRECARLAQVNEEIEHLPLMYDTLVGDMGSVLSGGQKQRILLARALYPKPAILFVDEGTAHLDQASERRVVDMLVDLTVTRVVIAHRSQAIKSADRIFVVTNGQVQQIQTEFVPVPAGPAPAAPVPDAAAPAASAGPTLGAPERVAPTDPAE